MWMRYISVISVINFEADSVFMAENVKSTITERDTNLYQHIYQLFYILYKKAIEKNK